MTTYAAAATSSPEMSQMRKAILAIVKRRGSVAIGELARELQVSYEASRQQVGQLHREGWLAKRIQREPGRSRVGRPEARFHLTEAGDHLFPKHYDELAVALIDSLSARFGAEGVLTVLTELADSRVREWAPRLEGLDLQQRLEALQGIYLENDPFVSVERADDGGLRLVERNCPFLNVARERPALCSLTVSVLTRLLGYRVVREKRFQAGDGCCAFRVLEDRPVDPEHFRFELETPEEG
ncbi:MAG: helix-turn-helix transcriptional regulator [Acidobacteriota bacterium]